MNTTETQLVNLYKEAIESNRRLPSLAEKPVNKNGYEFKGINRTYLALVSELKGYKDQTWLTPKQVTESGYYIKKGEKAVTVEGGRKDPNTGQYSKFEYKVFNKSQINGIELNEKEPLEIDHNDFCMNLVSGMGVNYNEGKVHYPKFDFKTMTIQMPTRDNLTPEAYTAYLINECAKATMQNDVKCFVKSSVPYKDRVNTCVALATAEMCGKLGVEPPVLTDYYANSMREMLEKDPDAFIGCVQTADKCAEFMAKVGGLENYLENERETELSR